MHSDELELPGNTIGLSYSMAGSVKPKHHNFLFTRMKSDALHADNLLYHLLKYSSLKGP